MHAGGRVLTSCTGSYNSMKTTISVLRTMIRATVILDFCTGNNSACFLMSSGIYCVSERISTIIFFLCETELMLYHVWLFLSWRRLEKKSNSPKQNSKENLCWGMAYSVTGLYCLHPSPLGKSLPDLYSKFSVHLLYFNRGYVRITRLLNFSAGHYKISSFLVITHCRSWR